MTYWVINQNEKFLQNEIISTIFLTIDFNYRKKKTVKYKNITRLKNMPQNIQHITVEIKEEKKNLETNYSENTMSANLCCCCCSAPAHVLFVKCKILSLKIF